MSQWCPARSASRRWHRCMADADEQALKVVIPGLFDLATLDPYEIDNAFLLLGKLFKIEAEREVVLRQFLTRLLKPYEYARLAILHRAPREKLHSKQRLAAACAAAAERRPATGQATPSDFIESLNARRRLGQAAACERPVAGLQVHVISRKTRSWIRSGGH